MKKLYLLLVLSCFTLSGFAQTHWYSTVIGGHLTNPVCWNTTVSGSGTTGCCWPTFFQNPLDTFEVQCNMILPDTAAWRVAGTVILSGAGVILRTSTATPDTMGVGRAFIMKAGTRVFSPPTATVPLVMQMYGDFEVGSNAFIHASQDIIMPVDTTTGMSYTHIHFCDTNANFFAPKTVKWAAVTNVTNHKFTNLIFDRRSVRKLVSDIPSPIYADHSDSLIGTLICDNFKISGYFKDTFRIDSGAHLYTTNQYGIDTTIQQFSSVSFSPEAHYHYNGSGPQITGITLPNAFIAPGSVTVTNRGIAGVTLSQATTFDTGAAVNLDKGTFIIGSLLTMDSNSRVNVDSGYFSTNPIYKPFVHVTYMAIEYDSSSTFTTGYELLPVALTTSIGDLMVNKRKSGSTIILGSAVTVNGDVLLASGTLDTDPMNFYTINANGSWFNNSNATAYAANNGALVKFGGASPEIIGGAFTTTFSLLEVNSTGGVTLGNDEIVEGQLTLTNGTLDVDLNDLKIGSSAAPVGGTFSSTTKIIAASTGQVQLFGIFTTPVSYFFPIGDAVGYSPIFVDLIAPSLDGPVPTIGVNVSPVKHPNNANASNYLDRYWKIYITDISTPEYTATAYYDYPSDVVGTEANISGAQYIGPLSWFKFDPVNTVAHSFTTWPILDPYAEITGITTALPTVTAPASRRICYDGATTTTLTATASTSMDVPLSYAWTPSIDLSTTVGLTTTVNPTATGVVTYTITVTDGNGFTGFATTTVTVDPAPYIPSTLVTALGEFGLPGACAGRDLYLSAVGATDVTTYLWTGPVPISLGGATASAQVLSVTPSAAGVYTLTVTNGASPGCTAVYTTTPVVINALPGAVNIATPGSGAEFCLVTTINVTPAVSGETVYYQPSGSGGTSFGTVATDHIITLTGCYYYRAGDAINGCWGPENSKCVTINPLPAVYKMTGGGRYCDYDTATGVNIGMEMSDVGTTYYLYDPASVMVATVTGTGSAIDFGKFTDPGYYWASAVNVATGCTNTMDVYTTLTSLPVEVYKVALPFPYNMTGGGGYCISGPNSGGRPVGLEFSEYFTSYQLYYRDNTMGALFNPLGSPVSGMGLGFDFPDGPYTGEGMYMVMATNLDGCADTMATSDSIWINPLPNVYSVTALDTIQCEGYAGASIKLDNSDLSVVYQLYQSGSGTVGLLFGGTGGSINFGLYPSVTTMPGVYIYTVQATDTNNCVSDMTGEAKVTVNPAPIIFNVTGGDNAYCDGLPMSFPIGLDGSELDIRYELYNSGIPTGTTVDGDGIVFADFGLTSTPGYYEVRAENLTTGCFSMMNGHSQIVMNVLPYVDTIKGGGHYCDGVPPGVNISNTGLAALFDPNVQYFLYDSFNMLVGIYPGADFGDHMTPGTYHAIARNLSSGCESALYGTVDVVIDSLPHVYNVIGGGDYCVNDTIARPIGIFNSQIGIDYEVSRDGTPISIFAGTGTAINFGSTVVTGVYTVEATNPVTGCVSNMLGSASVIAHPIPVAYNVTGGGRYCEGSGGPYIMLDNSENSDLSYQLYRDGAPWGVPVLGAGTGISFGPQDSAGLYTAVGTNTVTGCVNAMDSFAFVVIKPIPVQFTIAGGGPYCYGDTGRHVYLSGSLVGTNYHLYRGFTQIGSMPGTGFGLDFGLFDTVGTYVITGELISDSCQRNMIGSVTISINSLPPVHTVTGGGTICADSVGTIITLSDSDPGVRYRIYRSATFVDTLDGTGSGLTFGPLNVAGTYTVTATDLSTACMSNMTGSGVINVNPLPTAYSITGGGAYCAGDGGLHIGLASSETGVLYQLRTLMGTAVGAPQLGTGSAIDFGLITFDSTFSVFAYNSATGCSNTMSGTTTIVINPLPDSFVVTGGGSYCQGGAGMPILLSGSQTGISYQLYAGSVATGTSRLGTGTVINFGLLTADSTYTVMATNTTTHCIKKMGGSAAITIVPYLTPTVTLTANPGTVISVGQLDTVVATVTGAGIGTPSFAWRINGNPVPGANTNTLVFTIYYDNDTIDCDVTSSGMCGGITTSKRIIIHLKPTGVKDLTSLNGNLRLIPNPNKGTFSLKGNIGATSNDELDVEVTNMLGQAVYRGKIKAKNGEVDEYIQLNGNLANGMYLLNLRSENASGVFHFVVEQ